MHRTLNLDDLIAQKAKKDVEKDPEMTNESLYDLIIPPGTVVSIIYDIVEEFDLEPITREMPVSMANREERESLVLRGPLEKVQAAEAFLYDEMKSWIENQ